MNHTEKKYSNRSRKKLSLTIAGYYKMNVVHKIIIGIMASLLVIGVLSSFTIINKEAEPAEQHQYGPEIKVHELWHPESHYVIKIFRYFEIFPYMRTYLYRFTPTDYKKICIHENPDDIIHNEVIRMNHFLRERKNTGVSSVKVPDDSIFQCCMQNSDHTNLMEVNRSKLTEKKQQCEGS